MTELVTAAMTLIRNVVLCLALLGLSSNALAGLTVNTVAPKVYDFEADFGAIPDDDSTKTAWHNGALLNTTLATLQPGDTFVIPEKTFHVMGGIYVKDIKGVTISINGALAFSNDLKAWPRRPDGHNVRDCLYFDHVSDMTFTSTKIGLLDGQGKKWWGFPGIGYLIRTENRPKLIVINNSTDILVENLLFKNSPYWTFWAPDVDGLEVRNSEISARRTDWDSHSLWDITAFNTDGFDVTGKNVWIHDCKVWNQDDTIAVKDGSENMLFERIEASGIGLTIGSIGNSVVRNITFRDCHMHNTYKGIYLKFRDDLDGTGGLIEDVLFENIVIDNPSEWPIWIGPAQQSDSRNPCAAHPCSICWPTIPFAKCHGSHMGQYRNIKLKDITVNNPTHAPGVIISDSSNPMSNIEFENVVVNHAAHRRGAHGPQYYKCEGVQGGIATGTTHPVPPCFEDRTTRSK